MIWIGTSGYNYPEWKGTLLSGRRCLRRRCSRYYCRAIPDGRNQLHVLSAADREAGAGLGGRHAVAVQAHAEGAQAHHARPRLRDTGDLRARVLPCRGSARRRSSACCCSSSPRTFKIDLAVFDAFLAELPQGRRAAFEFRQRVLARRRRVRAPARPKPRALHRRQRHAIDARSSRRPTTATSGCATRATRRRRSRQVGRRDPRAPGAVGRHLRLLQARGRGEGPGVRPAADGAARCRHAVHGSSESGTAGPMLWTMTRTADPTSRTRRCAVRPSTRRSRPVGLRDERAVAAVRGSRARRDVRIAGDGRTAGTRRPGRTDRRRR